MPHQLIAIDETPFPLAMPVDDLSTGEVDSGLSDSVGSRYNYWGSNTRYPRSQEFSHTGLYEGEIDYRVTSDGDFRVTSAGDYRVTSESKLADLRRKVENLKLKNGQWSKVWRKSYPDGAMTFKFCRLLHVEDIEKVDNAGVVAEVTSKMETLDVAWRSAAADLVTATIAAGDSSALLIYNRGRYPVNDAVLKITCTSGTITAITVVGPQIDFTWTGTLAAAQTLTIDDGNDLVPIASVDAYSGLTFGVGHTTADWLPLPLGLTPITVAVVGGAALVTMEHYDRWP